MSKTKWTLKQEEAIYKKGCNLLISAGAGSGKTAVLTERILDKLKQGISIDELVVLTFTNAAAFEMKERVRHKLIKEISNGNTSLKKELDKLDSALICTFDSFSLQFLTKYHYLLDIDAHIHICDSVVLISKKKKILDEVFQSFYKIKDQKFLKFIDTFSMKDDQKIQTYIYNISLKLNNLYNKKQYLETNIDLYYNKNKINNNIQKYENILGRYRSIIFSELEMMEGKINNGTLLEWYEKVRASLSILEKGTTYETYRQSVFVKLPTLTRSKKIEEDEIVSIKEHYESIKSNLELLKKGSTYENTQAIQKEIYETKETAEIIIDILKEYENRVLLFKKEYNMYEFSDIARFAIEILENHPDVRILYKENIKEIMIDEYQDTNDIGEYFVSLIASNNIYMVGDVKQSIYGFRNANPSLFMNKYEIYKQNKEGYKIDLTDNFRSRREVLDPINLIFEQIMDVEIGEASYKDGHQMVFGNQNYEIGKDIKQNNQMEILDYHYEKGSFTKEEIEAFIVAKDILHKKEANYQIMDSETGKLRKIMYQDCTILMDRKTNFDLYKKIFTYLGIPLIIHKEEEFVTSNEIYVVRSILKLVHAIANHLYTNTFAHSFMSVARSFLFDYTDDQIFDAFIKAKENHITLYKSMKEGPFMDFYYKLESLSKVVDSLTLQQLLQEIYFTFDIYNKINRTSNVKLGVSKLQYLLDIAVSLEEMEYSLEDFILYFDEALKNKIDASFTVPDENGDSVHIMTIHKSKGLEFPVCYYSGLYKKFSVEDFKDKFLLSDTYGIVAPVFYEGVKETIYKTLVKDAYLQKDISEKIRLFYVALTRAKEKMIFVMNIQDDESEIKELSENVKLRYHSFYDMLVSVKQSLSSFIIPIKLDQLGLTYDYAKIKQRETLSKIAKIEEKIFIKELHLMRTPKIEEKFAGHANTVDIKTKKQMETGNKLHEYLEWMDFSNKEKEYDRYAIKSFYREKIEKLFEMPFMKALVGNKIYKEYEFIMETESEKKHGIIDLLIETDDVFIIVDYKLKEIEKESYKNQIEGYKTYIRSMTNKKVEGYLYSLIDGTYKKV